MNDDPSQGCGHCNLPNRQDGHDACLGVIVGAMNACCGHGDAALAYVQPVGCTCVDLTPEQRARDHLCAAHVAYFDLDPGGRESLRVQLRRATRKLIAKRSGDDAAAQEREQLRVAQDNAVMPMIGPLLDAWDQVPNDLRGELEHLGEWLARISGAMDDPPEPAKTGTPECQDPDCCQSEPCKKVHP